MDILSQNPVVDAEDDHQSTQRNDEKSSSKN
jgi:hypothetical protein